jgi:hypothetical protein
VGTRMDHSENLNKPSIAGFQSKSENISGLLLRASVFLDIRGAVSTHDKCHPKDFAICKFYSSVPPPLQY